MYKLYRGKAQWCDGKESTDSKSSDDDQPNPPKNQGFVGKSTFGEVCKLSF